MFLGVCVANILLNPKSVRLQLNMGGTEDGEAGGLEQKGNNISNPVNYEALLV